MKRFNRLTALILGCAVTVMRGATVAPPDAATDPNRAKNLFAGHTVYSIVLEVPNSELLNGAGENRHIGVWAISTLATDAGGWRSVNRVGLPMIHPLFTPYNEDLGNRLNAGRPADDFATYGAAVIRSVAGVIAANGTAEDPKAYAESVAHRLFPNILPYEVGTPAIFGFVRWNGRSLSDNAPNVMFSLAANSPVRLNRKRVRDFEAIGHFPVRSIVGERGRRGLVDYSQPRRKTYDTFTTKEDGTTSINRPPLPPFTLESATRKVRAADK